MKPANNIGGVAGRTPSPCYHQYEKRYSKDGITVYECYWCHHQLVKYGGGSKSFVDGLKPSLSGGRENLIGGSL